jgi:hypothetical protein
MPVTAMLTSPGIQLPVDNYGVRMICRAEISERLPLALVSQSNQRDLDQGDSLRVLSDPAVAKLLFCGPEHRRLFHGWDVFLPESVCRIMRSAREDPGSALIPQGRRNRAQ